MKTLPENYRFYLAYVFGKQGGCGPFEVITSNTINSTSAIRKMAHNKYPDGDFENGEVLWVESPNEPPPDLVTSFQKDYDEAVKKPQ